MKKFKPKMSSVSLVSCFLYLASCLLPIASNGYGEEKFIESEANLKGKECIPIEADEMQRRYENKPLLFDNMFIFDIRPLAAAVKGKSIPFVKQTSWDMFRVKYLHNVPMWRGKDVYLVGEDTESTKSFCEEMIKKDYGVNDIYYLKGGIDAWNGPVRMPFKDVQCDGLDSNEIKKRIDEGQKVYLIDWRYPDDFYNNGHIPDSINGYGREGIFGGIEDMLRGYFRFRPIYIKLIIDNAIAVFIDDNEWKGLHRCRIEKRASGVIDKMYYLKGGIENWKGALEKELWQQPIVNSQ
ncbi:MAG: hypothetical protein A3I04_01140 [Nitrospinae bacterium RIFCSPLOWO2_02_FULL_39_110]|nr:MAG: hypothetical protein A2W53_02525 [Nitrospinae bacterium RIFCSPHIGHO2_02_39_11]OGW00433.1 MAG: hypothetical protein A3D20_04380 [Nitrospinae bacterium RIFCSPHIGHO2_02_FULL_39_82]OGW04371.1 MAG: hypothetical protein A3I04_01140 [Nitrospinae bacterium RIFCSPLOWO2_02_FULL_39_110]OGW04787.1 MAG: hypothetical protein A2Z59_07165 [Nitrospinae bacterium RIFCSPLOWO2_02_39_17]OGW08074.1 MAG: hypothetical protein A2W75_06715 [Nitrospinae bacterium RIFCSPLOWO2_12_39_15]OGW09614.1 MAG: hypothetical